jgi:hypothetical protein
VAGGIRIGISVDIGVTTGAVAVSVLVLIRTGFFIAHLPNTGVGEKGSYCQEHQKKLLFRHNTPLVSCLVRVSYQLNISIIRKIKSGRNKNDYFSMDILIQFYYSE